MNYKTFLRDFNIGHSKISNDSDRICFKSGRGLGQGHSKISNDSDRGRPKTGNGFVLGFGSSPADRAAMCLAVLLSVMALSLAVATQSASAVNTTSAYELIKLDKKTVVNKDHSYDVSQTISVNLPNKLKELSFVMPSGNFKLEEVEVDGKEATLETQNDNTYVTISNKNDLTKGKHDYVITYRIVEFADRNDNNDLLYYDALLPEWRVPIGIMSIYIQFPEDFPWTDMNYYAGQFGSKSNVSDLKYIEDKKNKTIRISGSKIPQNYSVTIKAQLPDGYWENAQNRDWAAPAILITLLLALVINLVLWLLGGRDPKIKRRIYNKPVEGIYPSDISYILENKIMVKDLITLIFYMATKGYLKISEYQPKRYRLLRVADPKGEEKYIRSVYNTLFDGVYEQRYLESDEICPRMREIMKNFAMSIEAGFSDKSMAACTQLSKVFRLVSIVVTSLAVGSIPILTDLYQYLGITWTYPIVFMLISMGILVAICYLYDTKYERSPRAYKFWIIICILAYAALVNYELYKFYEVSGLWYIWLVAAVLGAGLAGFSVFMKSRGKGNAELSMQLKGLRKWINNAGPKHVAPLQYDDPDYYYSLMPYAMEFQSLETWAKAFRGIHIQSPDWYVDDIEGHAEANLRGRMSTLDYARDMKIFVRTIEDEYETMMRRYHRSKEF